MLKLRNSLLQILRFLIYVGQPLVSVLHQPHAVFGHEFQIELSRFFRKFVELGRLLVDLLDRVIEHSAQGLRLVILR